MNVLMKMFFHLGRYALFIHKVFSRPDKHTVFFRSLIREMDSLGVSSLGIIAIISLFMGAAITIQTAYNLDMPLIPRSTLGVAARDSIILEFSSTIVCLILAGKVGSNIASEIGSMRVSEQIDALDIMGINSANYLVMPKVFAMILITPVLVLISMALGISGGLLAGITAGVTNIADYTFGLQYNFKPFYVFYSLTKSVVFAFIISTVSSYWGYYTPSGSLEVGRSSTRAVVISSIQILLFNLLLTQLLLT